MGDSDFNSDGDNDVRNIYPVIWGQKAWFFLDSCIAVLPCRLSKNDIEHIMALFKILTWVLPCRSCRLSYLKHSSEHDTDIHDPKNYVSRNKVISLIFNIKQKIQKQLDIEDCISLKYYTKKLNYLICDNNNKNLNGIIANIKDSPFIQDPILDKVLIYLKERDIDTDRVVKLIKTLKNFLKCSGENDFCLNNPIFNLLIKRSSKCEKYRDKIEKNKILYNLTNEQSFMRDNEYHVKLFTLGCNCMSKIVTLKLIRG
jgi:hypothetical protein